MLDVHPPHHAANTWRDFFIHIATISVGLLIAIGLEQTVEAIHHHHQREYLEEQMHEESERNLALIKTELHLTAQTLDYYDAYQKALTSANTNGAVVTLELPEPHIDNPPGGIIISPARATWAVAKASSTVGLLPADTAKVYDRVDVAAEFEQQAEIGLDPRLSRFKSTLLRIHLSPFQAGRVQMTPAQRDELLFATAELRNSFADFQFRLAILEGALQAILDRAPTLEQMYPYQQKAVQALSTQN